MYASPSNPLGWTATVAEQKALLDFARQHGLWLLADEVYERIYYGGQGECRAREQGRSCPGVEQLGAFDPAALHARGCRNRRQLVLQDLSNDRLAARLDGEPGGLSSRKRPSLNEFIVSHAPTMVQRGGEAAIAHGEDDIAAMVEEFQERRDFSAEMLRSVPRRQFAGAGGGLLSLSAT